MITQEYLKSILHYDQNSGIWTWINGAEAGSLYADGYIVIRIDLKRYKAHVLAWLYMENEWPETEGFEVDHKDLNRSNNKWNNLRIGTRSDNLGNHDKNSNNKSGIKNVHWNKQKHKWTVQVCHKHVGHFDTLEEAGKAAKKAADERFGEFSRPTIG